MYEGKEIFHFASLYDHLLCEKKENLFYPISGETSEKIKDYLGLKGREVLFSENTIDQKELLNYSNKSYSLFLTLNNKLTTTGKIVDLPSVEQMMHEMSGQLMKLSNENIPINASVIIAKMREGNIESTEVLKHAYWDGYYDSSNNTISIDKEYIDNRYMLKAKRVIAHELIHRSSGPQYILNNSTMHGLIEGETENLVEHLYGNNTSTVINVYKKSDTLISAKEVRLNVSDETAYPLNVALVQQMEYLLGEKSYQSILEGRMEFENKFIQAYGLPLFIILKARSSKHTNKINSLIKTLIQEDEKDDRELDRMTYEEIEYFQETQDILLKRAFNYEFTKIKNAEDAHNFLIKLRNFEPYRARFVKIEMGKTTPDSNFEYYYNEMYEKTNNLLEKMGYVHLDIFKAIGELFYVEQPSFPDIPEDKVMDNAKKTKFDSLVYSCMKYNKMLDPNDIRTYLIKIPKTNDYCLVSTVNALVERAIPLPDVFKSRQFIKDLIQHETKFDEYIRISKYEYEEINFEKPANEVIAEVTEEINKENDIIKQNFEEKKSFRNVAMDRVKEEVFGAYTNMKQSLMNMSMTNQEPTSNPYVKVCSELSVILNKLNSNMKGLIPDGLWLLIETFLNENMLLNYNSNVPLEAQDISDETRSMLAYVYRNYLCDENEQIEYDRILEDNIKNRKMNKMISGKSDKKSMVKYDENGNVVSKGPYTFFRKLKEKIKRIFHIY
jgi:hypothetical protein